MDNEWKNVKTPGYPDWGEFDTKWPTRYFCVFPCKAPSIRVPLTIAVAAVLLVAWRLRPWAK